jgi:hypothetical protein
VYIGTSFADATDLGADDAHALTENPKTATRAASRVFMIDVGLHATCHAFSLQKAAYFALAECR